MLSVGVSAFRFQSLLGPLNTWPVPPSSMAELPSIHPQHLPSKDHRGRSPPSGFVAPSFGFPCVSQHCGQDRGWLTSPSQEKGSLCVPKMGASS
ncbi:hypothetical protein ACRRTK_022229 [Alexandromys fortis]